MASNFKVGQLIRQVRGFNNPSRKKDCPILLLVKYIPGMPDGKYWMWQALYGEEMVDIQSYNEFMYDVVV